jgi:hypothetical protein
LAEDITVLVALMVGAFTDVVTVAGEKISEVVAVVVEDITELVAVVV